MALCGNLVKGYGETSESGHSSLTTVLKDVEAWLSLTIEKRDAHSIEQAVARVRSAREAALVDPEGRALARSLGLPPPPIRAHPIRIVRRPKPAKEMTL